MKTIEELREEPEQVTGGVGAHDSTRKLSDEELNSVSGGYGPLIIEAVRQNPVDGTKDSTVDRVS